jgi:hypothetical protein
MMSTRIVSMTLGNRYVRASLLVGAALLIPMIPGCGPAAPTTVKVSGTVTLDANPMPDGDVFFKGDESKNATFKISNGAFSGDCQPGNYRVEIMAYKEEARQPDATGYAPPTGSSNKVNYIPAEFNSNSTLKAEVKTAGPNDFKFEVKSK